MKNSLLRNGTMAVKICIIAFCFLNVEKTFAQGTGWVKCYADKDKDGYGDPNDFVFTDHAFGCGGSPSTTSGRVSNGLDCNDNDANEFPGQVWYKDLDDDKFTSGITLVQCERPAGYKTLGELRSGETRCGFVSETLDYIDCDENTPNEKSSFLYWFIDNDQDGAVANFDFILSCSPPPPQVGVHYIGMFPSGDLCNLQTDCNDNNAFEKPSQEWYIDADGDGFPLNNTPEFTQCQKPAGDVYKARQQLISTNEDCNDQNAAIFPGTWYQDQDGDGATTGNYITACIQPEGYIFLPNGGTIIDCNDNDPQVVIAQPWYTDADGDDHGTFLVNSCSRPPGGFRQSELTSVFDCNDNNANVNPGISEFCNGMDDDCDFQIDETYCCPPGNIIYVNAANTGAQDGTSWAKAFKYLQDALEVARRCNTVTQIWVASGSYYPDEGGTVINSFQPRGGLAIYGGFVGNETLLSQRTLSAPPSILSGEVQQDFNQFNNYTNLMVLDNINTPFVLDGFTIQDGYSNIVVPLNRGRGVGLLVLNSTSAVQIRNCTFRNNVGNYGAAIANVSSMPEYINCVITGNTTMIGNGAIWNDNASPRFVNCSIANNAITGSDFIIIRNTGSAFPIIINSIVRGTSPAMDGGSPLVAFSYIQNESLWPGIGNINSDPLFVDEANGNLRLQPGSPAINAGAYNLAPINYTIINNEQTDIEGKPRTIFQIDMGAYEDPVPPVLCSPISLTSSVLQALQFNGCGTGDISSTTFPYSSIPAALISSEYSSLNLSVAQGSCDIASITYKDVINPAINAAGQVGVIRTFTITDANGSTATATQQIKVVDETLPVFTGSFTTVILGCNPVVASINASLGTANATDACGVTITSTVSGVSMNGCLRTQTKTFKATDALGNTASVSRTVQWTVDLTPPIFTGSYTDVSLSCNPTAAAITSALGSATATDACGAVSFTSTLGNISTNGCQQSRTITFKATDACGNTSTMSRTARWKSDINPPVFTGSYEDIPLGCNPADVVSALGTATATDACGSVSITSSDGGVNSFDCLRWKTRTFTATDECGNTSKKSRTLFWTQDLTLASFTGSYTDIDLGCNPANPAASLGTATATDACGTATISSQDGSVVSNGCNRSITRTFTSKDGCNNTTTVSRTVRWKVDLTPPVFTGSYTDINAGYNPVNPQGSLGTANAIDVCGAVTISTQDGSVVSNGCNRSITRIFTATDGCYNTATVSRKVTWISDVTPPTVLTQSITVQLTAGGAVTITASQVDNGSHDACGGVTLSLNKYIFYCQNIGPNTVTLTATDGRGNTSTATATVIVEDHVPPTMFTKNITVQLNTTGSATITHTSIDNSSYDACGIANYSLSKSTFNCSNVGPNTVTLKATDANGNTATAAATVTVVENLPPTVNTQNVTIYLNASGQASLTAAQVNNNSTDNCSIPLNGYLLSKTSFDCSNVGSNTVTLKSTDANGNTATASAVVTVEDNVRPVITSCPTVPVQCYNANGVYTIPALTASDNCGIQSISYIISGATSRNGNGNASGAFNPGTSTITWKVTDVNSNTATCATTVKVDKVDATIADAYASGISSSIGSPNTIYIGYGGSSVTLMAQVSSSISPNSYTYKWTVGSPAGPGFANTQSITVSPSATTTYFVSIKDANNCSPLIQVQKQIKVVDIRCGNNKINVCQFKNGSYSTSCVSSYPKSINSLSAGSYLGTCVQSLTSSKIIPEENITESLQVRTMPNPSSTNFRIVVNSNDLKEPVKLLVTDMLGRVIETRITNAGQTITIGDKYISGTYAVRIIQGRKSKQLSLIKLSD